MSSRLPLFPITTQIELTASGEALTIAGCDLSALTARFGTPLYLYDRATLDFAVATYRKALAENYPGESEITYAGKAYLCLALAQWTQAHQLWVDCTGVGELQIALAAGVPRDRILIHGVNKSPADLAAAVAHAGTIVVDHLEELDRLAGLASQPGGFFPDLWLRIRPGLAVDTHVHTQTGQHDSKFGIGPQEIIQAADICRRRNLPLNGLHFHQGSFFHDAGPVAVALETALDLLAELKTAERWTLCPGGGWGVAYHEDQLPHPPIERYVAFIAETVVNGCRKRGLALPRLQLEPGRSLVARAGVALYQVGAVKRAGDRRWLLVDGGLADNPRPALYGARYSALPVSGPGRPATGPVWLAGPYCESGDILIESLPMPEIETGELIAVPVSGAYHLSMASNYNGARRPAVLWLDDGRAQPIQTRETKEDLIHRDRNLPFSPVPGAGTQVPDTPGPAYAPAAITFAKFQSLGNDYLVLQGADFQAGLTADQVRRICDRHYGAGADGILLALDEGPAPPFALRIFNADGSESETSGNGLRIFARYLYDLGLVSDEPFEITTPGGKAAAVLSNAGALATIHMGKVSFEGRQIPVAGVDGEALEETLMVEGQPVRFSAATIGNPHCVLVLPEVSPGEAQRLGPQIETHERFPNRTNVQFMKVLDRENIRIEIWERGAGYTLASGSSSCAAAAVAYRLGMCAPHITVHMPGGSLRVTIQQDFSVSHTGPVDKVFEGRIPLG